MAQLLFTTALLVLSATVNADICTRTGSVEYQDPWGPVFTEHAFTCSFPSSASPPSLPFTRSHVGTKPLMLPAPYSHVAGQRGADPQVRASSTTTTSSSSYEQQLLAAAAKLTIPAYGCTVLPAARRLARGKYSSLFWGMRQLTNQTCVAPNEAREFTDLQRKWSADWRFVVSNRGTDRACEWWSELANVAEALHYVCYFSELGTGFEEMNAGEEAVAWGQAGELRWCLRYSKRGWDEGVWRRLCLGV